MIEIKNVSKTYNGKKKVLKNVSVDIDSGEIFAFIGHNGAGKTTMIKSIIGILDFEEGDILIDGKFEEDLKDLTLELRGSSNQRILTKEDIYGEIEKRKKFIRTTAATRFATRIKK